MEATAVPDMKNSSSTIRFFFRLSWKSPSSGGCRGHGGRTDSVQGDAASDWLQPLMTNVPLATDKRHLNFYLNSTLEKSRLCIRNKNITPPTSTLWLWSRAPPQAGQLGSYSCILTQRGFVHWSVGNDGKAGKDGKTGKTRTNQAAASPPSNVLESSGSPDKSLWFKDTQ